ncbi:unnamed protein product [Orchesella dallaii]|uniref:Odorant receptor n=1 Tax=Orchesella dallaii TaxID=48710 RepID=A0ABP1R988_9HEXA
MISWMHISLMIDGSEVKAYFNGLIKFYSSYFSMPGARFSAKVRQSSRRTPCLVDLLVSAFIIGAIMNITITGVFFFIYSESYQFTYSVMPPCWKAEYTSIKFLFVIYEIAMPGISWTLILFFLIIHLVHLLCTRDYLVMMRKNTRNGILQLNQLLHHYRSIQILQNHYNECIASYMPLQLFVVVSLTLAGNIGTIRLFHKYGHGNITIPEMTLLPMVSLMTIAFQLIFYQRAGELHHLSSFYCRSSKKGLYKDSKLAKMYLKSFTPLCVQIGDLLKIRKFTVVKFVSSIVVGTARLSVLFFRNRR